MNHQLERCRDGQISTDKKLRNLNRRESPDEMRGHSLSPQTPLGKRGVNTLQLTQSLQFACQVKVMKGAKGRLDDAHYGAGDFFLLEYNCATKIAEWIAA